MDIVYDLKILNHDSWRIYGILIELIGNIIGSRFKHDGLLLSSVNPSSQIIKKALVFNLI